MPMNHSDDRRHILLAARARSDTRARDTLVRELMPVAERVGRRFASAHHPAEDLAQVAGIGLLKAIDRFDPAHAAAFTTYAHALMTGEVRRHLRDSRFVRVPRSIYEQVPRFQRTLERLSAELHRTPTRDELAHELGVSKEELVEIADAALTSQPVSLEASLEDGASEMHMAQVDDDFERAEAGAALAPMLRRLTPRERLILDLRFTDGLSQAEIAAGMGISQTQVSRLLRAALAKMSARALPATA
jgi:RNA polymerase sigma-B factor